MIKKQIFAVATSPIKAISEFFRLAALLLLLGFSLLAHGSGSDSAVVWVDVRTWVEYQADHIEGDTRIHVSDIVAGVNEAFPDKETPIRLYCAVGGRAGEAKTLLREAGYKDVQNMGGIDDVRRARGIR